MTGTTKQAAPQLLAPPYRVIAGRGIVDSSKRVVATVHANRMVRADGRVSQYNPEADTSPGISPAEADALAHELVRVLNSHTRIVSALRRLMACPDVHLDDIEDETCDALDEAEAALADAVLKAGMEDNGNG